MNLFSRVIRRLSLVAGLIFFADSLSAQTPSPDWTSQYWPARWILHPTAPSRQYGVFHFRKAIELPQKPARFVVHVSADNRYRLFVNGKSVAMGPARSDTQNWNYETIDLAPYLQAGRNVLAAQVWYMGEGAPFSQMSYQLGFLLQGDTDAEKIANTDTSWKIFQNPAYSPIRNDIPKLRTYIVVGDGDRVDAALYPWGWEQPGFDDKAWVAAKPLSFPAKPRGLGTDGNWGLVPRTIPMMSEKPVRLATVRRSEHGKMDNAFLQGKAPVTISTNTKAVFLLDQGHLTNAYPELTVSGGKGATITLSYAEALVDAKGQKGNRNDIEGRSMRGFEDQFIADGSSKRTFRPLWFRTYRYLQLTVETKGESLVLDDLSGQFTGYPFEQKAQFSTSESTPGESTPGASTPGDTTLKAIWTVGWRTAQLCAGENYYDCPYYEQLQYTGDTRIQSLISLYVAGDDRLMRKAITDYEHSRFNDGLTQSRYPSADFQVIPTFSLFWVCMVHDYWMHRQDDAFVKSMLPGILGVLNWHEQRIAKTGLNGPLEWWNFVDWSKWQNAKEESAGGVPAGARKGGSSILSLQQAYTYFRAADLLAHYGQNERAEHYRELGRKLNKAVYAQCWDASRGLMADVPVVPAGQPGKNIFSQHANILAVLTDAVPVAQQAALLQKVMTTSNSGPDSLTQATFYFKFYLFEALKKTGLGDQFVGQLKPWRDMLAIGLTTFAENPEPTRSDCHAWSASPLYEFLSITCGIRPAEPGFKSVRIEPFLGDLTTVDGRMPHPLGDIAVQFRKSPAGGLTGTVTLPANLTGTLRWKGKNAAPESGSANDQFIKKNTAVIGAMLDVYLHVSSSVGQ